MSSWRHKNIGSDVSSSAKMHPIAQISAAAAAATTSYIITPKLLHLVFIFKEAIFPALLQVTAGTKKQLSQSNI